MSQYANIYLHYNQNWINIENINRSNTRIYPVLNQYFPYGELKPMTRKALTSIKLELQEEKNEFQKYIESKKQDISFIKECTNSLEDKLEALSSKKEALEELLEELQCLDYWLYFITFLENLIDNYKYSSEDIEVTPEMEDSYLWCGIEASPPKE